MLENGYGRIKIPKTLRIWKCPVTSKVKRDLENEIKIETEVTKVFVTDKESKSQQKTAATWAKKYNHEYCKETQTWKELNKKVETLDIKNKPFSGLQILDIEYRASGGRAYKCRTSEGWYIDVREEVILDTMIHEGIHKGGHMKGQFIWVINGMQIKVIRVGSSTYKKALEDSKWKKPEKIKISELEYGGVYQTLSGNIGIYLGKEIHEQQTTGKIATYHKFATCFGNSSYSKEQWIMNQRELWQRYHEQMRHFQNKTGPYAVNIFGSYSTPTPPFRLPFEFVKSHSYVRKLFTLSKEEIDQYVITKNP